MTQRLDTSEEWRLLLHQQQRMAGVHLRDLFAADVARGERMSIETAGLTLNYAKHRIDDEVLDVLLKLGEARELPQWRERMFTG